MMPDPFLPIETTTAPSPLNGVLAAAESILWVLCLLLVVCSPALAWAVWTWAL